MVLAWLTLKKKKEERIQKIDNLPILVTCQSDTLAILSSKVNGLVTNGSTQ